MKTLFAGSASSALAIATSRAAVLTRNADARNHASRNELSKLRARETEIGGPIAVINKTTGGPALFLINAQVGKRLVDKGQLGVVAAMFLIGTGSQVVGAVLNKISNWYVYRGAEDAAYREACKYKFFSQLVEHFWIDIALDVVTMSCFGFATWRLLTVFVSAH